MDKPAAVESISRGLRQRRAWLMLLAVAQMWFIANGQAVLGRQFPVGQATFYLSFMMYPLILDHELLGTLLKGTVSEYAFKFTVGFVLGLASYFAIFSTLLHSPAAPIAFSAVYPMMAVQLIFVAPAEELFFRAFMPRLYDPEQKSWQFTAKMFAGISMSNALWVGSLTLADVATSATFSGFHYAAYGANAWVAFTIAFGLSIVWLIASRVLVEWPFHHRGDKRAMGIALTIGWHFAFNMCAFGILTGGVIFDA